MGKTSHAAIVRHTLGASFEPTLTTTRSARTMEGARSGLLGPSRTMKRGRREEGLVRGRDGGRLQEDPELQGLVHNYWTVRGGEGDCIIHSCGVGDCTMLWGM